ncbi:hypothetical protein [Streptomyces sp. NPDC048462]|uniref:hypothetical protein n=1 Tax=Streptomyces sp. NPDC048462 TaxID=3365555 RepID=UPI003720E4FD
MLTKREVHVDVQNLTFMDFTGPEVLVDGVRDSEAARNGPRLAGAGTRVRRCWTRAARMR